MRNRPRWSHGGAACGNSGQSWRVPAGLRHCFGSPLHAGSANPRVPAELIHAHLGIRKGRKANLSGQGACRRNCIAELRQVALGKHTACCKRKTPYARRAAMGAAVSRARAARLPGTIADLSLELHGTRQEVASAMQLPVIATLRCEARHNSQTCALHLQHAVCCKCGVSDAGGTATRLPCRCQGAALMAHAGGAATPLWEHPACCKTQLMPVAPRHVHAGAAVGLRGDPGQS
mmetsp:Transcript_99876/g.291382  ORF Transcript_99876/g.291382 Transcript_99876/m.291382 type:complete len:233 (+) Transcript_99876:200-898(+)